MLVPLNACLPPPASLFDLQPRFREASVRNKDSFVSGYSRRESSPANHRLSPSLSSSQTSASVLVLLQPLIVRHFQSRPAELVLMRRLQPRQEADASGKRRWRIARRATPIRRHRDSFRICVRNPSGPKSPSRRLKTEPRRL